MYVIALAKARTPIARLRVDHVDQSTRSWAPVEISMGGRASAPPPHQKNIHMISKGPLKGGGGKSPKEEKLSPTYTIFFEFLVGPERGGLVLTALLRELMHKFQCPPIKLKNKIMLLLNQLVHMYKYLTPRA